MPGKLADVSDSPSPAGSRTPGDLIDNAKADGEGKEAGKDEGKMNGNEEDLAAALEIVRRRQKEVELENERPCVFKSLSPVSRPFPSASRWSPCSLAQWICAE
jgi:hypothetical protein